MIAHHPRALRFASSSRPTGSDVCEKGENIMRFVIFDEDGVLVAVCLGKV